MCIRDREYREQGIYDFEELPLGEVLERLEQWYDIHFTVDDPSLLSKKMCIRDRDGAALADLLIVSKVEVTVGGELAVSVSEAAGTKCPVSYTHLDVYKRQGLIFAAVVLVSVALQP